MANKEKTAQTIDILRVEGIMAQGYGLNPKIVMRDKRLTTTAKAIYAYIASFAGGGSQAFPNRDMMLDELGLTKDTYYKHMKILRDTDYIRVERTKINGAFDKNIYVLVALPNPVSTKSENVESAGNRKKSVKRLKAKEKASVNELRERLRIDGLKEADPKNENLIEEVFMAVEDINSSEQISIGGTIKKREAIQTLLNQLTADHIRLVVQSMVNNKKMLTNRKTYLQACLINSIFNINNKNQEAEAVIEQREREKEQERIKEKAAEEEARELKDAYAKFPELEKIDNDLTEIMINKSKSVLSKNEIMIKNLEKKYDALISKREKLLKDNSLDMLI